MSCRHMMRIRQCHLQLLFAFCVVAVVPIVGAQEVEAEGEAEVNAGEAPPRAAAQRSRAELEQYLIGPFNKDAAVNPVLGPRAESSFYCPWHKQEVRWEEKDVFNPAAVVKEGRVHLLYRAEDTLGAFAGTSRIGLAVASADGLSFPPANRHPHPVLYPAPLGGGLDCCDKLRKEHGRCEVACALNSARGMAESKMRPGVVSMAWFEGEGGCEDPRVVQDDAGAFWMTYTAYDGRVARLCIASSPDLVTWERHGLAFKEYPNAWSKAGSIPSTYHPDGRVVAARLGPRDQYYMLWGEGTIKLATSPDLKSWTPLHPPNDRWGRGLIYPRPGSWDSDLVEPGPAAVVRDGLVTLIYNSKNAPGSEGRETFPVGTYSAGQVILDASDPTKILYRSEEPFIWPDQPFEIKGQINNVVFVQGLVQHQNQWLLYYGTADSLIGVASCPVTGVHAA